MMCQFEPGSSFRRYRNGDLSIIVKEVAEAAKNQAQFVPMVEAVFGDIAGC